MTTDQEEALPRPCCADCGVLAPETDTDFTLLSARHGWRMRVTTDAEGRRASEWRCAECWARRTA